MKVNENCILIRLRLVECYTLLCILCPSCPQKIHLFVIDLYIPASWTGHVGKLVFYWTGHNCTQYVVGMSRYIVCRKVIYNKNDHQQR